MSTKIFVGILASILTALGATGATISFQINADLLKEEQTLGSEVWIDARTSTLVLLVADTGGDGWQLTPGDISLNIDGLSGDDRIIARTDLSVDGPGVLSGLTDPVSTGGIWQPGQSLALFWIPTLTISSNTINVGTFYGSYETGDTDIGPGEDWITPSVDSFAYELFFYTSDGLTLGPGSNPHPASDGNASKEVQAVPEPSTGILLTVSVLALFGFRRRRSL